MSSGRSILGDLKYEFGKGNMVTRLIFANLAVFVFIHVVRLGLFFASGGDRLVLAENFGEFLTWLAMPMQPSELILKPWTVFTHMFVHVGFMHILFNMLYLFWFGRILHSFVGERKILPIYIYGGLVSGLLSWVLYLTIPGFEAAGIAYGASGAVMAILLAAATIAPNYTIFLIFLGPVRLKYIALFAVAIDLISIPATDGTNHFAHLIGAAFGFMFIKLLQSGTDLSIGFNKTFDGILAFFAPKNKPRVAYKNESKTVKKRPAKKEVSKQEKLDEILDKIARSGYDSLSKQEKEFLFKVSQED